MKRLVTFTVLQYYYANAASFWSCDAAPAGLTSFSSTSFTGKWYLNMSTLEK